MTEEQNILIDDLSLAILQFIDLSSIIGYNLSVFSTKYNKGRLKTILKEETFPVIPIRVKMIIT